VVDEPVHPLAEQLVLSVAQHLGGGWVDEGAPSMAIYPVEALARRLHEQLEVLGRE
jgi:hypothetical protein